MGAGWKDVLRRSLGWLNSVVVTDKPGEVKGLLELHQHVEGQVELLYTVEGIREAVHTVSGKVVKNG